MRRVFGFLFVLAGASCAVAVGSPSAAPKKPVATPTHAVVVKKVVHTTKVVLAPADEYFGPMKMSILGIRNEIHLLDMQYAVNHDAHQKIVGMAQQAEASLLDWEKKYPSDTMLARHVYLLEHLYAEIDAPEGHAKATATAQWLFRKYSKTWYAKNLHVTLAREQASQNAMATTPSSLPDHAVTSQTPGTSGASVAPITPIGPASSAAPVAPAASGTTTSPASSAPAPASAAPSTSSSSSTPSGHGT